jgi:hypothetical protein
LIFNDIFKDTHWHTLKLEFTVNDETMSETLTDSDKTKSGEIKTADRSIETSKSKHQQNKNTSKPNKPSKNKENEAPSTKSRENKTINNKNNNNANKESLTFEIPLTGKAKKLENTNQESEDELFMPKIGRKLQILESEDEFISKEEVKTSSHKGKKETKKPATKTGLEKVSDHFETPDTDVSNISNKRKVKNNVAQKTVPIFDTPKADVSQKSRTSKNQEKKDEIEHIIVSKMEDLAVSEQDISLIKPSLTSSNNIQVRNRTVLNDSKSGK